MTKIENPTYSDAMAFCALHPDAVYVAEFDVPFPIEYRLVTLTGSRMRGFLMESDTLLSIERWF